MGNSQLNKTILTENQMRILDTDKAAKVSGPVSHATNENLSEIVDISIRRKASNSTYMKSFCDFISTAHSSE
jgi:hypothetical protein